MSQPSGTPADTDATLAYQALGPAEILDAVDGAGQPTDGHLLVLNSYENRVYRLGVEDSAPVVAKFYRPGRWSDAAILEEHEFTIMLAAEGIPAVPPLVHDGRTLHRTRHFRFAVYPCRGGHAPALDNEESLRQIGRMVAMMHQQGALEPFRHRPRLDIDSWGHGSSRWLLDQGFIPDELTPAYQTTCTQLMELIDSCYEHAGSVRELRLHGDFHPGNVLADGEEVHIVDFDDARSGPAIQDLWMFLSGEREEQTVQLAALLEGYTTFRDFDPRELHLVEALRTLRILHYSAWIGRRWEDPAFRQAFPWFDTPRYWNEHILSLREQAALMQEEPLHWWA